MTLVPFIRVLHIVPRIESGGVENYLLDLTKHLKDYHIKSYLASAGGKLSDAFKKNDVYLIEGHFHLKNPLAQIINAFHLCKIIHQHHIDLVHVHSRAPAWATIVASKVMKVPSLSTFHGVYAHTNLFKRFYNSAMLCVDGVIAISQYVDNHVRQTYPDKTKNLHLIEEGIDINRFDPALISIDAIVNIKKQLGISDTTKVLSLIGRFSPIKGHEVAIQAFEKLVSQFDHSFHLLFHLLTLLI